MQLTSIIIKGEKSMSDSSGKIKRETKKENKSTRLSMFKQCDATGEDS